MNKDNLIAMIVAETGERRASVAAILDAFQTVTTDALCRGEKVTLSGFGTFELKSRASRVGRNPKTNEAVLIPAKVCPAFVPSAAFKTKVSGQ